jgi:type III pantothenate kinase
MTSQQRPSQARPLIALDVGNSRIKLGVFARPLAEPLPQPLDSRALGLNWTEEELSVPNGADAYDWTIASVNRPAAARLVEFLKRSGASVRELKHSDLAVAAEVERPDHVGLDRLANVLAVNRIRRPHQGAIIIDMGSCLTFNLVSPAGAFAGGAILPGLGMSARALDEFTDALPRVEVNGPAPALGKNTVDSIRSGLYWGAVGAVRALVAKLSEGSPDIEIFLTGGAGPLFETVLGPAARPPQFLPHLTLAGIALASVEAQAREGAR